MDALLVATRPSGSRHPWRGPTALSVRGTLCLLACGSTAPALPAQGSTQACAGQEFYAADPEAGDRFGASQALDGDALVVGAPAGTLGDPTPEPGTAYVFRRAGAQWTQEARLVPSDGQAEDHFGLAVALEGDVLAGGSLTGVYVFDRVGGPWIESQKLTSPDPLWDVDYGASIALSGNWLAVGDRGLRDGAGVLHGALYLYERQGGSWVLRQRILGSGSRYFGRSLDLRGDTLAVGADAAWGHIVIPGAAMVLVRDPLGQWNTQAFLTPSALETGFGAAVALDGDRLAVGSTGPGSGSTWLYTHSAGLWSEETHFGSPLGVGTTFGSSVGLSGSQLLVGEPNAPAGPAEHWGRVWIFEQGPSAWQPAGHLAPAEVGPIQGFGANLALDGGWLVVGTEADDDFGSGAGSTWPYLLSSAPGNYCTAKPNSQGCTPAIAFTGSPASGAADDFHVVAAQVLSRRPGVLLWSTLPAATPFLGGILCLGVPLVRTPIQQASGVPPPALDCSGAYDFHFGRAYIAAQGLAPGTEVFAQYWSRDPGFAPPNGAGLTDALRFTICGP